MQFFELNCLEFKNLPQTFIYFLTLKGEVVYVGQTNQGLFRALTHKKDKDFDDIWILPCDVKDLDLLEDMYIKKYIPLYNKQLSRIYNYSISKCLREITAKYGKITKPKFKKILKQLNIEIRYFNDFTYLTKQEFEQICKYMESREV